MPKHRIEEAAAARAAKVDLGETVIVGVNRYRLAEEEEHDILEVDNARVRAGQIKRLEKTRATARKPRAKGCPRQCSASGPTETANLLASRLSARGRMHSAKSLSRSRTSSVARHRASAGQACGAAWKDDPAWARARPASERSATGWGASRDAGRQDGPGRPRPRRQPGVVGLHRSGLRGNPRPAVPDPRRERGWRSRKMSTWSAPRASPPATRP